ncbi:MAG TPA: hypothetical protein VFI08_03410 [Spirochaetia bacterium]|nr:hypothetical protein [Spirochaetia bacterium]
MSKTVTVVLILLAVACPFWAQAATGSGSTAGSVSSGAPGSVMASAPAGAPGAPVVTPQQFSVRFFDQKVYFLGDPIKIEAVITNTGIDTLRFKVADNKYFNFEFDVRSTTNVGLEHARQFTTGRSSDQPVFFREMDLQPGEKYGIVVDLTEYVRFDSAGQYVVQATFYPDLFRGMGSVGVTSNRLALNVRPAVVTEEEKAVVEAQTGALNARQVLPPDEVVGFTIAARQKSQWEKFFLYLDLDSLLRKNPEKDRSYRNATEAMRRQMVEQFRQQLEAQTIRQDISVVPTSFDIQNTSYTPAEATVQVLEKFKYPDYTELKSYTYHLVRSDKWWVIDDYSIRNLGTQ